MVPAFSPMTGSVSVSATASNVAGAITMPALANALYVVNTSTTVYVSIAYAASSASTTLGGGPTIPPGGAVLIEVPPGVIGSVSAIGSAAGPTAVVFTPARVQA